MKKFFLSFIIFLFSTSPAWAIDFGVGSYLSTRYLTPDERAQGSNLIASMNIKWVREEFNWNSIQPARGIFKFDTHDDSVSKLMSHGINIVGLLAYSADWANPYGNDRYKPNIEDWENFVRDIVNHYKDQIQVWEIWNEENYPGFWKPRPDASQYKEILEIAYRKIKEINPGKKVLVGGLQGVGIDYLEDLSNAGGWDYFDGIAIHPYRSSRPETVQYDIDNFIGHIQQAASFIRRHGGGKKIWITEVGWSSTGGISLERQANYLIRATVQAYSIPEVEKVIWYDLRNDSPDLEDWEANYGLLFRDFTQKPASWAARELGDKLKDENFIRWVDEVGERRSLDDFETGIHGWRVDTKGAKARISQAFAPSSRGAHSLRFDYQFLGQDNNYVRIKRDIPLGGFPTGIGVWISGHDQRAIWRLRIVDRTGEIFQGNLVSVTPSGWGNYYHIRFSEKDAITSWGGNSDGKIDYPIRFDSIIFDDYPDFDSSSGIAYFDDLTVSYGPDDFYVYSFSNWLVAWKAAESGWVDIPVRNALSALVFNREGNFSRYPVEKGKLHLNLDENPVFILPES